MRAFSDLHDDDARELRVRVAATVCGLRLQRFGCGWRLCGRQVDILAASLGIVEDAIHSDTDAARRAGGRRAR